MVVGAPQPVTGPGVVGPGLDGVASGELIEPPVDALVDRALKNAAVCHPVWLQGDGLAFGDVAAAVVARVDGVLENVNVPAVELEDAHGYQLGGRGRERRGQSRSTYKVRMQSIARRIPEREHKGLLVPIPHIPKPLRAPGNLEEDRDNPDRVGCRTGPVVVALSWVGHMGSVVGAIQIHAVPARGKVHLRAQAVRAVGRWEPVGLRGAGAVVVQARKAASGSGDVAFIAAVEGAARDHPEPGWGCDDGAVGCWVRTLPCFDIRVKIGRTLQRSTTLNLLVVDESTAVLGHLDEAPVLRVVVQRGNPVVGLVLYRGARVALRRLSHVVVHCEAKARSAHDGMDMARCNARLDNRVCAFDDQRGAAGHLEKCEG